MMLTPRRTLTRSNFGPPLTITPALHCSCEGRLTLQMGRPAFDERSRDRMLGILEERLDEVVSICLGDTIERKDSASVRTISSMPGAETRSTKASRHQRVLLHREDSPIDAGAALPRRKLLYQNGADRLVAASVARCERAPATAHATPASSLSNGTSANPSVMQSFTSNRGSRSASICRKRRCSVAQNRASS